MNGHHFALLWGPLAIVFGACFVIFRRQISRVARAQRERRGYQVRPTTQSPLVIGVGGGVFVVAGIVVLVGALTGFLR